MNRSFTVNRMRRLTGGSSYHSGSGSRHNRSSG